MTTKENPGQAREKGPRRSKREIGKGKSAGMKASATQARGTQEPTLSQKKGWGTRRLGTTSERPFDSAQGTQEHGAAGVFSQ
jgi:hypothetical protein